MIKDDAKYLHAAARVHALESRMISQQDFLKAIEAANVEDAFKILAGKEMFREFSVKNYETALQQDLKKTYEMVEGITGKSEITYIFRYPTDGHNLKVYAKGQLLEKSFENLYKYTGTFSPEKMEEEILAKRFDSMPEILGKAVLEAMHRLAITKDSQIADILIDKAVLSIMGRKAQEIGNPLLIEYVGVKIDLINIETAIRLMRMKKDAIQVKHIFAEGGTIEPENIKESFSSGYEGIVRLLDRAGKTQRLEQSISALKQGKPLTVFEQNLDACFKDLFDKAKVIPFGLEPVIVFLYLKEREIRAARMVLVSKSYNLPKEQIAERIRYMYAD